MFNVFFYLSVTYEWIGLEHIRNNCVRASSDTAARTDNIRIPMYSIVNAHKNNQWLTFNAYTITLHTLWMTTPASFAAQSVLWTKIILKTSALTPTQTYNIIQLFTLCLAYICTSAKSLSLFISPSLTHFYCTYHPHTLSHTHTHTMSDLASLRKDHV